MLWGISLNNWSGLQEKFYKRIPIKFDLSSFYIEFPLNFFLTRKSFVNFFPDFKLEIGYFSEFAKKVANVLKLTIFFTLTIIRANFQQNQRNFFFEKNPDFSKNFVNFFSKNLKKISNVPKFRKFIYPKIQVCEVSEIFIFSKKWPL